MLSKLVARGKPSTKLPRGGLSSRFIDMPNYRNGSYDKVLLLMHQQYYCCCAVLSAVCAIMNTHKHDLYPK